LGILVRGTPHIKLNSPFDLYPLHFFIK